MLRKRIGLILKPIITVLLFVLLFRPHTFGLRPDIFGGVTPRTMWEELQGARLTVLVPWLLFGTIIKLAGMMAGVLRWRLLLQGQGLRIPFSYLVQSWFVGRFYGIFLPSTIGLDGYRLYDSSVYTGDVVKCATVVAVEKLIGFVSLTFLLFLTFPLGFRLLNTLFTINLAVFAVILVTLAVFVICSFLLLLNPRVIQVLVAVTPTPARFAEKFNKLGLAATAYSGNRALLLKATFYGFLVHLSTCFLFFGMMMAIRAQNTTLWDVFFVSPIMIYGTVLGPSIGGEGIREIIFVTLLSGTTGATAAALFSHLGWWAGDVVPFLIGAPIMVLRSRRPRAEVAEQLAEARKEAASASREPVHLSSEEIRSYRRRLLDCVTAGAVAGLLCGALIGLGEGGWVTAGRQGAQEWSALWWGPLFYGPGFAVLGTGIACALAFLYLLADRFPRPWVTLALSGGGALAGAVLVIGRFRFQRDVLGEHPLSLAQNAGVLGVALGAGAAAVVLVLLLFRIPALARLWERRASLLACALAAYLIPVAAGAVPGLLTPAPRPPVFAPERPATGPNMILIVADALRADYLPMYGHDAVARTPHLDALAGEGVLFECLFAQASWTKPSFATIFTGRYPESHRATSKTSRLPEEAATFAEILREEGYYTQGFANNPNITVEYNFDQGFVDYVDLRPSLLYGAGVSASRLTIYDVLRKVTAMARKKLRLGIQIAQFYQPAEEVTRRALDWIDSAARPGNAPFLLFLHYMDPHDPFMNHAAPGVGYARVTLGSRPSPEGLLEPMREAYNSEIEHMDRHLGVLFDGLRERGLFDDTVILFTSDHGEEFYDHDGWWHGQTLYDELIHVPFIVKLPRGTARGAVNGDLARHIDIPPTLLAFAGAPIPEEMAGVPLVDVSGVFANADIRHVYAENDFEGIVLQAVRTHTDKLIRANEGNWRELAPVEFYRVADDPAEQENLAGSGDEVEARLSLLIDEMAAFIREGAVEPSLADEISDEERQRMRDLGYMN